MKNLLACLAILAAFNVSAQTETSNFPYNPDVDGDGIIGVADILELLGTFGNAFQVQVQLNADSTSAIYFPPDWFDQMLYYAHCQSRCDSLPGPWHIMTNQGFTQHLGTIRDSILATGSTAYHVFWQFDIGSYNLSSTSYGNSAFSVKATNSSYFLPGANAAGPGLEVEPSKCLCELRQRPRMEYDFCEGNMGNISTCAAEKVSQGWYPLELTSAGGTVFVQTFWRWED